MKRKIVFIDSYFDCLYGAQKSMLNLALLLKESGHDITVYSTSFGKLIKEAQALGLNSDHFSINEKTMISARTIKKEKSYVKLMLRILISWLKLPLFYKEISKNDTICINDIRCFVYFFPIILLCREKIVWYVRVREEYGKLVYLFSKLCRKICFVSNDLYSDFEALGINIEKMRVIHTGFPKVKNVKSRNSSVINFVTVGSICERKNQMELIDLFYKVHLKTGLNHRLTIIGDKVNGQDTYYNLVREKVRSNVYLRNHVDFTGYINSDAIEKELVKYDIFLFSSLREGLPRCLIEALQAGLLIVTRRVEGVNDIVINDRLGYVYDNNHYTETIEELSRTIESKVAFSEHEKNMRHSYAENKFSENEFIRKFIEL